MALRIVKINASTAIEVIDLTAPVTVEVSIERDSRAFDAGQRGVEFPLAYQERVVLSAELGGILSLEPTARRRNDFSGTAPIALLGAGGREQRRLQRAVGHLSRQRRSFSFCPHKKLAMQATRLYPQQHVKTAELSLAHRQHRHGAPPGTPEPGGVSPLSCRGVSSL
jgi:hypothetical protein